MSHEDTSSWRTVVVYGSVHLWTFESPLEEISSAACKIRSFVSVRVVVAPRSLSEQKVTSHTWRQRQLSKSRRNTSTLNLLYYWTLADSWGICSASREKHIVLSTKASYLQALMVGARELNLCAPQRKYAKTSNTYESVMYLCIGYHHVSRAEALFYYRG